MSEYENVLVDSYNWIPVVPPNAMTIHPLDYISYIPGSDVVMLAEWSPFLLVENLKNIVEVLI